MNITDEAVNALHESLWAQAIEKYGDEFAVPSAEVQEISNRTRALYVLQTWAGGGSPARYLSSYSIPNDVITEVLAKYYKENISEDEILAPRPRRADKYAEFVEWAEDHFYEQFTTEQLVEKSGFSYPTTLKFIQECPTFRKIKKGLWEIRDAEADRVADKNLIP